MSSTPVKEKLKDKSHWVLAALLLSQLFLMTLTARNTETNQSLLGKWVMTIFAPVVKVGDGVLSKVTGTFTGWGELRRARDENIELKNQVEQLTTQLNETREKAAQYDALRVQYGLPSLSGYRQIAANVIARNTSLWFKRLTIDRGTLDGVKKDMPIVTNAGIIGRVINVGANFAQVQIITDSNAGVGVMIQSTRQPGELKGLNNSRCEIKNIPSTEEIAENEIVVTTGLDRIYPKGLVVGTTEHVENDANAPYKKIIVRPAVQIDRVEAVIVLLIEQKDIKFEENLRP
ncbi:MAG: rod shape-determining protein MreC [Acidobacteriota bacterium]